MHACVVIKELKWISLCAWRQSDDRSQYRRLKVGTHNRSNSAHKGRHCVEEIWAIADTNCNWKVWMASLIESEHAHRQIIFRSRLLVLGGLSHSLHERELSAVRLLQWEFFVMAERKGLFLSTDPAARAQTNSLHQYGAYCHPPGSADAGFPRRRRREIYPVAWLYSVSFLCLPVCSDRHVWLPAAAAA